MSQSPNIDLALRTAQELVAHGVREICLCAGARNSPLITVLGALSEAGHLRAYHYFEERSAAFFALGRAKAEGRPVAVITTSGTAVAELLPAVIEAQNPMPSRMHWKPGLNESTSVIAPVPAKCGLAATLLTLGKLKNVRMKPSVLANRGMSGVS